MPSGYIGVDETNEGRFPTIFVGAFSADIRSVQKIDGRYDKQQGKTKRFRRGFEYYHVLFERIHADMIGKENFMVIAAVEFARAFSVDASIDIICIDGVLSSKKLDATKRVLHSLELHPHIIAESKADENRLIVNEADGIARKLHDYYLRSRLKRKDKYLERLLTPDISAYVSYL